MQSSFGPYEQGTLFRIHRGHIMGHPYDSPLDIEVDPDGNAQERVGTRDPNGDPDMGGNPDIRGRVHEVP